MFELVFKGNNNKTNRLEQKLQKNKIINKKYKRRKFGYIFHRKEIFKKNEKCFVFSQQYF